MNRQFPALCGIAMLLIIANHTITMGLQSMSADTAYGDSLHLVLSLVQSLGVFAVPVFLFISGTFVSYAARGEPSRLNRKFVLGSLVRILYPYLFWSIAFYLLIFLHYRQTYTPQGYIKNLLVGYPFHFIPLLIFFYVLSPILVQLIQRHALMLILGISAYQIFLLLSMHTAVFPDWIQILSPPAIGHTLADWAVYFPLGLVYGLHMNSLLPSLRKIRSLLLCIALFCFVLGTLDARRILATPVVGQLAPAALVLVLPAIERQSIPWVKRFENVGKHSYGLYLTHLITLDLTILAIAHTSPGFIQSQVLFLPILFFIALMVPLLTMNAAVHSPVRRIYRFIFG